MNVMVTSLYAGLLGALYIVLSTRVMLWRFSSGVVAGDDGDETNLALIRGHANFFEFVPMTLLLILVTELSGAEPGWIHAMGAGLVVARVMHAVGMWRQVGISFGRRAGTGLTMTVLSAATLLCVLDGLGR